MDEMSSKHSSDRSVAIAEVYTWIQNTTKAKVHSRPQRSNLPTYSVRNGSRGPDLIVCGQIENYALVVQDNSSSDNIHDGAQTLFKYWLDYSESETKYVYEGDAIEIDAFLLASQSSKDGHLFDRDRDVFVGRNQSAVEVTAGGEPLNEWGRSTTVFRTLYRAADVVSDGVSPGIGILASSDLCKSSQIDSSLTDFTANSAQSDPSPRVHYYCSEDIIVWEELS